jgi:uncharacterized protein
MKKSIYLSILFVLFSLGLFSQSQLYPNTFNLGDVTLLDGPFKHAQDLNVTTLLKYNVDRLLAPYRKVAKLPAKALKYGNWESDGLDGHIGGHYLSAMAIHYAATGNAECKKRMDYMVAELKLCQDSNTAKYPSWGVGYAGGVVKSDSIWPIIKTGNMAPIWSSWVPWYNLHKTYAGLRDAWVYGGNEDAKTVFLKFCDWALNLTAGFTDAKMEEMLGNEHGGINEVLADAYQMTGQAKYLTAAKRFSHKWLLNSMATKVDNLDNVHANTQVPKAVGFQRIAEVSKSQTYITAGSFFWETVAGKRSLASGGNSRAEVFPAAATCIDYINRVEGPESCNTNNMLKLTEDLFRMNPLAKYTDYYERALYNHILSTQHPDHGGYVYFTPARPRHYRVYSAPEKAMWCCVGTGMENHGKYGEFIYTHQHDSLFVNLFIPSTLNWSDKAIRLKQETKFPYEEKTKITITDAASVSASLMIRYPKWVTAGKFKIVVNGDTLVYSQQPQSYIPIKRIWNTGDSVVIIMPMHNSAEQLPNVPSYIAFLHGPILLGAKTGTQDLSGLVADANRWAHIAGGTQLSVINAPILVDDNRSTLVDRLMPVQGKQFTYKFKSVDTPLFGADTVQLVPFYTIHDSRYMMYWMNPTKAQYKSVIDSLSAVETARLLLENRTLDFVQPGQQQPEADHSVVSSNSGTGTYNNESWRDASGYFSYALNTKGETNVSLMVRYWGNESGSRSFNIYVDGVKLVTENIVGKWKINEFKNVEYPISASMIEGKSKITVKFTPLSGNVAGGAYFVRLLKANITDLKTNFESESDVTIRSGQGKIIVSGSEFTSRVNVFNLNGKLLKSFDKYSSELEIQESKGIYVVNVINEKFRSTTKLVRVL